MSVTRSGNRKEDPLGLYVDFLNSDLSSDPRPKLKKGRRLKNFLDHFERDTLPCKFNLKTGEPVPNLHQRDWLGEARELQGEMRHDLWPIAAGKEIPEKLFPSLERWVYLTERLNEMGFSRRWDIHPHKKQEGRVIIRGWNFKPDYNQRDIGYLGLAERLEDGDLERLRFCPICKKYFSARDRRQRFCGFLCKEKYDNADSKNRVKRYRAKQEINILREEKNKDYEQSVKKFRDFVKFAISHDQDIKNVGPMVLRLGQGSGPEGWKRIEQYADEFKKGIDPHKVFSKLPEELKYFFKTL